MKCEVCKKEIGEGERHARIERGNFAATDEDNDADRNKDHIKFGIHICQSCFLSDEDLCRFFNKLGHRIR